jgi:hypothetical protein
MNSCVCSTARFRNNDGRPVVRAPNVFGDHFWRVSASQIRVKIPDCGRLGFGLSFEPLETREAFLRLTYRSATEELISKFLRR